MRESGGRTWLFPTVVDGRRSGRHAERGHGAVAGGGEGAEELAFLDAHGAVAGDDVPGGDQETLFDGQGADGKFVECGIHLLQPAGGGDKLP